VEAGRCSLVVLEARSKDEGQYEVTARNVAGEAKAGCDVAVKVKPIPEVPELPLVIQGSQEPEIKPTTIIERLQESELISLLEGSQNLESTPVLERSQELELTFANKGVQEPESTSMFADKEPELSTVQNMEPRTPELPLARDLEPKAPRIQLPLKDLAIIEGAGARLDCIIVGQPEPEVRKI
jgi:hypothetical protein